MDSRRAHTVLLLISILAFLTACQQDSSILPKTGQTLCYDEYGEQISCLDSGQDGYYLDGIDWPESRFTIIHCDSEGPCAAPDTDCNSELSDDVVLDNLTGLMWVRDGNLAEAGMTWPVTRFYIDGMINDLGYNACGYNDWHLPNVNEMESLIHFGFTEEPCGNDSCTSLAEWLNENGFINIQTEHYWTSTLFINVYMNGSGIRLHMLNGDTMAIITESCHNPSLQILPVRDASDEFPEIPFPAVPYATGQQVCFEQAAIIPCDDTGLDGEIQAGQPITEPRFTDNGDGTIYDETSGLTWIQDVNCIPKNYPDAMGGALSYGGFSWEESLALVDAINGGEYPDCSYGHNDWRMPNVLELNSLMYYQTEGNAKHLPPDHPFDIKYKATYWTSTTDAADSSHAWVVDIRNGTMVSRHKITQNYILWLVRID